MPELPEVETIRRTLAPGLIGRRIAAVTIHRPTHLLVAGAAGVTAAPARPLRLAADEEPAQLFARALCGRRIVELDRRGKYLILQLDSGERLIVHLRMTGSLVLRSQTAPLPAHASITWELDDGQALDLADLRRFATVWLTPDERLVAERLGPEPLDPEFFPETLAHDLARRRAPVKAVLLDQRTVAGLGNIYVDEALFEAGIHPQRPASTLSAVEAGRLHAAIRRVIERGVANRGTSLRSYRDGTGNPGANQFALRVFRRTGGPCDTCGTPIERTKVGGRSSHFCPSCQPRHAGRR